MAIASRFTHPNRAEPAIQLQLNQQEADWLHGKLRTVMEHSQSMQDQLIATAIKDALTPVTGYLPS